MAADRPPHGLPYNELWRERRFALHQVELPLRGGGVESRAVVVHPGAVVLLPLLEGDRVVLIRNHRWTVDQTLLELPAGTCEAGEEPLTTAARSFGRDRRRHELTPGPGFWAARPAPSGCTCSSPAGCAGGAAPRGRRAHRARGVEHR